MEKEINKIQVFECLQKDCTQVVFSSSYERGLGGFARPPKCPKCQTISNSIQGIGSLVGTKTKDHRKYAKIL
jgi:hypothetical protein